MPQKVDQKKLLWLYGRDVRVADICTALGCCRSTVKDNLRRLGVQRRPKGWRSPDWHARMSASMKRHNRLFPRPKNANRKYRRDR